MWIDKVPESTQIVADECKEQFYEGDQRCVLLLHGYTGSPHDMIYLGKRLHQEGFSVYIPRLPGHGTNHEDFLNSNHNDWLRKTVDSYINLSKRYKEVFCCGLSMGGLLVLLLSAQFNPRRIALAAPALNASNKMIYLTPFVKPFIKKIERSNSHKYNEGFLSKLQKEYWDYNWPSKASELLKLQRLTKKRLEEVRSDCFTIVSKADETVPLDVLELVENRISSKIKKSLILEHSPHVVVNDVEKEKVADEIINWFSE